LIFFQKHVKFGMKLDVIHLNRFFYEIL
jgi:hypothetical protein